MLEKRKKLCLMVGLLIVVFLLAFFESNDINYHVFGKDSPEAATELTSSVTYTQTLPCMFENTASVGLQFANYGGRQNTGTVFVRILQGNVLIGESTYDAAQIGDGEYLYTSLNKTPLLGDMLEIQVTGDSPVGQGVTIWMKNSPALNGSGARLTINNEVMSRQLNCSIGYKDPKISRGSWILLALVCFLFIAVGLPQYYFRFLSHRKRLKRVAFYLLLLLIGGLVFSLRNLQFITTPLIYGEDGFFLARQLEKGLLPTLFATRSGGPQDFPNTGVYILIWLASKTTMLLEGYSLASYPFWAGVYANLFLAFTAVAAFRAFELLVNRKIGMTAYLIVLLVPMGSSSSEILGRPLNTAFMWTATVAFLLLIQYIKNEPFSVDSIIINLLCFIGAFTFPVCFLELGVYLVATVFRAYRQGRLRNSLLGNAGIVIAFGIGIWMLPVLLTVQGAGAFFRFKQEAVVEFFIARHFLYPFINAVYSSLNDTITLCLFAVYMLIVAGACVIEIRTRKQLINSFTLFAALVFSTCFSSAYMRRTMTEVCNRYTSTFPDRYYYACNVLAMLLLLVAIVILLNHMKLFSKSMSIVSSLCILALVLNPHLFYFTRENYSGIYGSGYFGTFAESCVMALQQNDGNDFHSGVIVKIYPTPGWEIKLPYQYVLATAESVPERISIAS